MYEKVWPLDKNALEKKWHSPDHVQLLLAFK